MKNFQIMRYLKKILPIIVIICVLATYAINFKLKNSNTFVASEVIHYNDPAAEQGLTEWDLQVFIRLIVWYQEYQ